jgi:hypothetical protein
VLTRAADRDVGDGHKGFFEAGPGLAVRVAWEA